MARTMDELTTYIDDDFRRVVQEMVELFSRAAKGMRARATHSTGSAARGFARIVVSTGFPENDFFAFGKVYPIILRHATPRPAMPHPRIDGDTTDDRMLDGGAASIKFFQERPESGNGCLDVMMNTGRVLFVPSARAFNRMTRTPFGERQKLIEEGDLDDDRLSEAYRTGSYTEFYYHSQIAFEFMDATGIMRYIKFRMIPGDRGAERGLFPSGIRANGDTFAPAWPDDERDPRYRRSDFDVRVRHLGVHYLLQAQIHEGGTTVDLSPMTYWDERWHPWIDVAELHLNEVLTYSEQDALSFDANRTPVCINLPLAKTADDAESIGHARALIYGDARNARANSEAPHRV